MADNPSQPGAAMIPVRPAVCLLLTLVFGGVRALEPHAGFRDIPWGASEAEILSRDLGRVVSTNRIYIKHFRESAEGTLALQFPLLAPTTELVIEGRRQERFRFFLSRDRLCFVIHRPGLRDLFSPPSVIEPLAAALKSAGEGRSRYDLELPDTWGRLAGGGQERFEVLEWDHPRGLVRLGCRTWPGGERREIFQIVHLSKEKMAENLEIAAEEKRKAEEEARRLAEEAARKAAEAAAAAAAAAGAAGAPPPR
jgi:hypothetical protein